MPRGTGLGKALIAEGLARIERAFGTRPVRIGAQARIGRVRSLASAR
jgi:predicted GNAT family N-acyltransferase